MPEPIATAASESARHLTLKSAAANALRAAAHQRPPSGPDEELHRAIVASSRDCIKTLAPDGTLLSIAESAREVLCVPDFEQLAGQSWFDFWQGADREAAIAAVAKAAAGGRGRFVGCFAVNGAPRWWDVMITPMRGNDGEIRRLLAVSRDVTEQKLAEIELRRSRQQLLDFVENATVGLHRVGPDGTILWANAAELELLGYRGEEYIGRNIAEFHASPEVIADILARLTRGERLRNYPSQMVAKDGSRRDVLIDSCVLWENGRFVHTQCFTRDVTAEKRAQELNRRLAAIVASSEDAIFTAALDETITSWNAGAERIFGYTAAEIVGQPLQRLQARELVPAEPRIVEMLLRGERVDHFETVRVTRDGRRLEVSISASPVKDEAGRIVGVAKIVRDITAAKHAEQTLRRSEAQINAMIDQAPLGIFVVDAQFRIQRINPKARPAFGRLESVLGQPLGEVLGSMWPRGTAEQIAARFRRTLDTGIPYREPHFAEMRADRNRTEYYDFEVHRVTFPDGTRGLACYFFDVSTHVAARQKTAEIANRLELALQAARLGFWRWDAATDVVEFSERAAEVFGIPPGPFMTWTKMQELLEPTDAERARRGVEQAVANRTDYSIEYRVNRPDGSQVWVSAMGRPIYADDQPVAMLGVVQDITARKRSEEELRESRAKLQEHAEALEQRVAERTVELRETIGELEAFSYSVSHDMRAPLRAMQGYSDRLLKLHAAKLDDEARGFLVRINKNSQRLELLVRDVLAYSKVAKSEIELTPLDLDAFVPNFVAQLAELQRDDIVVRVQRPLPMVRAHEAYLSQIFSNLLANAVKFAAPARKPEIEISAVAADGRVKVSVRDNGIGIDPQHFERIFEIFGRVYPDRQYEGTGIGLAIVKKAVYRMGGTIGVESALDRGSCFSFTLPSL